MATNRETVEMYGGPLDGRRIMLASTISEYIVPVAAGGQIKYERDAKDLHRFNYLGFVS